MFTVRIVATNKRSFCAIAYAVEHKFNPTLSSRIVLKVFLLQ